MKRSNPKRSRLAADQTLCRIPGLRQIQNHRNQIQKQHPRQFRPYRSQRLR
jgi:hypothetical protein